MLIGKISGQSRVDLETAPRPPRVDKNIRTTTKGMLTAPRRGPAAADPLGALKPQQKGCENKGCHAALAPPGAEGQVRCTGESTADSGAAGDPDGSTRAPRPAGQERRANPTETRRRNDRRRETKCGLMDQSLRSPPSWPCSALPLTRLILEEISGQSQVDLETAPRTPLGELDTRTNINGRLNAPRRGGPP